MLRERLIALLTMEQARGGAAVANGNNATGLFPDMAAALDGDRVQAIADVDTASIDKLNNLIVTEGLLTAPADLTKLLP